MSLTTDPNDPCIRVTRADGMQECYLILSEEERAKGFVRPVRRAYTHLLKTCGVETRMALELCETYARDPSFYGGTYCAGCRTHFPLFVMSENGERVANFAWVEDGTPVGS